MKALVVFGDATDHPLAFLLKPGFRHCFCALSVEGNWILVDGKDGLPDIRYLTRDDGFDLAGFYREQGHTVVETERGHLAVFGPFVLANCVALVKAVLGIRCAAVTPYQLYKHLRQT